MTPILGIMGSKYTPPLAAGSYYSIATATVTGSPTQTVTFSSIDQSYTHLELRWSMRQATYSASSFQAYIYANSDRTSGYSLHYMEADGSTVYAGGSAPLQETYIRVGSGVNTQSNVYGGGVTSIMDYTNTNKKKTHRTIGGFYGTGGLITLNTGIINVTSAITRLDIVSQDPNFAVGSTFALYGIKGA